MTDIRELDERTVERIAAGEVVERPASAVKELVENSIDADASRVEVAVSDGGREGIRVTDDGVGMSREAARRSVEEHTTSKIDGIDDLEAGVGTLGFRGEALHAIGAVSRMTITTRPRDGGEGTELVVEGGDVTHVGPAGCPAGTTVEVSDLFYNVPARRKYLKQAATEFDHVGTVVTGYALANPDVAVSLSHDGRETFATTGQGDLRETVMHVYGREVAQSMIRVDGTDLPAGPLDTVEGLVSHPETTRAGREYLSTYVNGRYVRANAVREATIEAYGTQLAPDRYPFAVLFCRIDPAEVDVNVHPRKREIRFADEAGVREQVERAVEQALLGEGLVRSGAPRGRSAPEQTEIAPGDAGDPSSGSSREDRDGGSTSPDEGLSGSDSGETRVAESTHTGVNPGTAGDDGAGPPKPDRVGRSESRTVESAGEEADDPVADPSGTADEGGTGTDRALSGVPDQARLGDAPDDEFASLPAMRILGQVDDTYVVAETDDGLALIDQHAADERINYERLREAFAGETTTQALAEPVELELTAREAAAFETATAALARLGFHAERTGDRTVEVRTLPGVVADAAGPELVRDALSAFVSEERDAADTVEAAAEELLADLACYPSLTGNTSLTEGSIRELLAALDDCENPYACPHGRPVIVEIDRREIEERFERDYPGHAGRRD